MRKGINWIPIILFIIGLSIIVAVIRAFIYKQFAIPVYSFGTTINLNNK